MTHRRRIDLYTAVFAALLGFATLRAGCTHWRVHVEGTVVVDPAYTKHQGAPLRVGLKAPPDGKDTEGRPFTLDTSHPLVAKYHAKGGVTYDGKKKEYPFQFCSGLTSVWYRGDLYAWLDLNRNGRYDPGEPRGEWKNNPLTREKEEAVIGGVKISIKPAVVARPRARRPPPSRRPPLRIAPSLPRERSRPAPRPSARP